MLSPFDYGLAFRRGTDQALVDRFSAAILALQEDGTLNELKKNFIEASQTGQCSASPQVRPSCHRQRFGSFVGRNIPPRYSSGQRSPPPHVLSPVTACSSAETSGGCGYGPAAGGGPGSVAFGARRCHRHHVSCCRV